VLLFSNLIELLDNFGGFSEMENRVLILSHEFELFCEFAVGQCIRDVGLIFYLERIFYFRDVGHEVRDLDREKVHRGPVVAGCSWDWFVFWRFRA
jgi:hypothetical protein